MVNREEIFEFKSDLIKGSARAFQETLLSKTNGTTILNGALACGLCVNMVRHNAVPLATMLVCLGCATYISVPIYKSLKEVIKTPFKGFEP